MTIRLQLEQENRIADFQQYEAKLAGLRVVIDRGDASGIAKGGVFARVRDVLHLPARR